MADPLFDVQDQVVVVSGGSRGIGLAIARGFVERNATVVITGRERVTLDAAAEDMTELPGQVQPMVCDVADFASIAPFVNSVLEQFGRIDTLVNVAGVNRRIPAEDVSLDDYDFIMDINLKAAFALSQEVGRHMRERGSGSQINIASLTSDRPVKHVLPYAMSKAGMAQMTRALAMEWGDRGVRVNALAPGFILTDLTEKLWSDPTMKTWGQTNTPQGRLGRPEDMVGTALFLAAPASAFMTGQVLYVDGGFNAGWAWPIPEDNQ